MKGVTFIHGYDFGRLPTIRRNLETPVLISSEAACGYPYPHTPEFSIDPLLANVRLLSISKVILFTREFNRWVLSLYFQTLNETSSWSLQEFIDRNGSALSTWRDAAEKAQTALSEEGVEFLNLKQEELMNDPDETIGRICSFVGTKAVQVAPQIANQSRMGTLTIKTYRRLNMASKFRLCRAIYRTGIITPRKLIQRGKLGSLTERLSRNRLSAVDVREAFP